MLIPCFDTFLPPHSSCCNPATHTVMWFSATLFSTTSFSFSKLHGFAKDAEMDIFHIFWFWRCKVRKLKQKFQMLCFDGFPFILVFKSYCPTFTRQERRTWVHFKPPLHAFMPLQWSLKKGHQVLLKIWHDLRFSPASTVRCLCAPENGSVKRIFIMRVGA